MDLGAQWFGPVWVCSSAVALLCKSKVQIGGREFCKKALTASGQWRVSQVHMGPVPRVPHGFPGLYLSFWICHHQVCLDRGGGVE